MDNRDTNRLSAVLAVEALGHGILVFDIHVHIGNDPDDRDAKQFFQHVQSRFQDLDVAAELIDDDALDPLLFVFRQQFDRPVNRREHAAGVDVADQKHRRVRSLRHGHVHQVALVQVDLGRTARAFDDDAVHAALQFVVGLFDELAQLRLIFLVFHGRHGADRLSSDDDLAPAVRRGLQQDGVHLDGRFDAGSFRLGHLGAAHLQPFAGGIRIQRHVLRLERRDFQAVLMQDAKHGRAEHGFADGRAGPLKHQRFSAHVSISFNVSKNF